MYKENFNKVISEFTFIRENIDVGRKYAFKLAEKQDKRKQNYYSDFVIDKWEEEDPFKKFTVWGGVFIQPNFDDDTLQCAFLPCRRAMTETAYRNAYDIDIEILLIKRFKFNIQYLKNACLSNGIKPKSKWNKNDYIKALMKI